MVNESRSLRGLVVSKWEKSGRPRWDLARTVRETEGADDTLASRGLNRAPKFRKKRGDRDYVERWTLGCRFPWLNPRHQTSPLPPRGVGQENPPGQVDNPVSFAEESEKQLAITLTNEPA